jgi:hypothetical protein
MRFLPKSRASYRRCASQQLLNGDRQVPHSLAGYVIHGIGNRGRDRYRRELSQAPYADRARFIKFGLNYGRGINSIDAPRDNGLLSGGYFLEFRASLGEYRRVSHRSVTFQPELIGKTSDLLVILMIFNSSLSQDRYC